MSNKADKVIPQNSACGRLLRFLFAPPPLGPLPPAWIANDPLTVNRFAERLAASPPDLVTHLGMVRSSAYFAAGCPLDMCDHAAARDIWATLYDAL